MNITTYIIRHNKLCGAISISQGDKFCHALVFYPPAQSYFLSNVTVSQLSTSMSTLSESAGVWNCFHKKKLITCSILENDLFLCWSKGRTMGSDSYVCWGYGKIVIGNSHAGIREELWEMIPMLQLCRNCRKLSPC